MNDKAVVLYFDDEIHMQTTPHGGRFKFILEYLRDFVDVTTCDSVAVAEENIRKNRYDILLLDVIISPESGRGVGDYAGTPWQETGVKLIERIRSGAIGGETAPDVPIIVISGITDKQVLGDVRKYGRGKDDNLFIAIIQKPPRLADIGKAIEKALAFTRS